ncbi:MAG: hypothetical protein HY046_06585 [Acidobacteria bacterium]|nr:hypothetical protein [Acidobacteriota bacterium]
MLFRRLAMVVCILAFAFSVLPACAQDPELPVVDLAKKERERKNVQPSKSQRVFLNDDLDPAPPGTDFPGLHARVRLPEKWIPNRDHSDRMVDLTCAGFEGKTAECHIYISATEYKQLKAYDGESALQAYKNRINAQRKSVYVPWEDTQVAGLRAIESATLESSCRPGCYVWRVFADAPAVQRTYLFSFTVRKDLFEQYKPVFQGILDSFRVLAEPE